MNQALVENAQHQIHRHQRGKNQQRLVVERLLEGLGGSLEAAMHRAGHTKPVQGVVDLARGVGKRSADGQVERNRRGGKLSLVIDRQRC